MFIIWKGWHQRSFTQLVGVGTGVRVLMKMGNWMKVYILNGEITSTVFLLCSQNACCLLYIFLSWNVLLWKNLTPGKWCKQWHLVSSPSIECHPALRLTSVQVLSSFWFCVMPHTSWTAVWRSLYWETKTNNQKNT